MSALNCSGEALVAAPLFELRIRVGEEQENEGHHQHRDGIDHRHRAPTHRDHDQRRDEDVQRGARVAGAEDAHREALLLLAEPGRGVGDADRERAARQADAQADHQVLPELVGEVQPVGRDRDQQHLHEIDHAPAVAVGHKAKRQADQRAGQDRGRNQQAKLGFAQAQFGLDLDADHREHRPHGEIDRKRQRVHAEDGNLLFLVVLVFGRGRRHLHYRMSVISKGAARTSYLVGLLVRLGSRGRGCRMNPPVFGNDRIVSIDMQFH